MSEVPSLDTWREAFSVFERLVALEGEARERELASLQNTRADLYAHVQSLLSSGPQTQAQALINAEAIGSAGVAGAQFGAYRLDSQIGSGGMGEVWLASRADGLFEGQAAVKLLHPYLSSSRVRERFALEGKILGRLAHPHIARLLDAGIGSGGALYLVIEHIEGGRIDYWCDSRQAGVDARVRLFLQVCEAVAYAHAHLVVHRDLKPSNVLVTADGTAKLLDFGIAKLLEQHDADAELTRLGGLALTPEFAAPEQLSGDPVSTATDIYALGLMLYLLLSGRHPFSDHLSHPAKLQQAMRESGAPPMSQTAAALLESVAGLRGVSSRQLARQLHGDLDNIVAKALRPEPAQRYPSALALAEDLRRYLGHEPVQARPESFAYRARKFVRRHWVGVSAGVAVTASLIAGLAGVWWQSRIAQLEAAKATAVKDFMIGIFEQNSTLNPEGAAGHKVTAEELLDQGARRIRTDLHQVPEVRIELLGTIGRLYQSLLVKERSLELRGEALAAARSLYGDERHPEVVKARVALGTALVDGSDVEKGYTVLEQALKDMDAAGDDHSLTRTTALLALAGADYMLGAAENPRARGYALQALELLRKYHPGRDEEIEALNLLGNMEEFGDHMAEAEAWYRQGLELASASADPALAAALQRDYGDLLRRMERLSEAEQHLQSAFESFKRIAGPGSTPAAEAEVQLAKFYMDYRRAAEAVPLLQDAIATLTRNYGADTGRTSDALMELGNAQLALGLVRDAGQTLQSAADARKDQADGANNRAAVLVRQLIALSQLGQFSEAEQVLQECRRIILEVYGDGTPAHGVIQLREAQLRLAQGRLEEARKLYEDVLKRWPATGATPAPTFIHAQWGLAEMEIRSGAPAAAAQRLQPLLRSLPQKPAAALDGFVLAEGAFYLGWALQAQGRAAEALPLLDQSIQGHSALESPGSLWLVRPRLLRAAALHELGRVAEARADFQAAAKTMTLYPKLAPGYGQLQQQIQKALNP